MHRQVAADAVAGAVIIIQPDLPQRAAGERIQMRAADALRKHRRGNGDVALQHARHALAHFRPGGSAGPVQTVRVMSVVPSGYCAPELIR